ncbi:hypothetical protein RCH09_002733 [Actimicrobium sp. GrIS 1.19]|nr:hypothetical protein [Actimicrobium sp. GrIS 1.19]
MTKVMQIMTVPEVRHRFAHHLGIFGLIVGAVVATMISLLAVFA